MFLIPHMQTVIANCLPPNDGIDYKRKMALERHKQTKDNPMGEPIVDFGIDALHEFRNWLSGQIDRCDEKAFLLKKKSALARENEVEKTTYRYVRHMLEKTTENAMAKTMSKAQQDFGGR